METWVWFVLLLQIGALISLGVLAFFVRARLNRLEHLARSGTRQVAARVQDALDAVALGALRFDYPVFFGGPAIRASLARELLWHLVAVRPRTVVELGSGSSTILLAKALQALGIDEIQHVVVDHDASFLEITRTNARLNGIEERIHFHLCPLAPTTGQSKPWYQGVEEICQTIAPIDLLLVDGPPAFTPEAAGSRSAALPALHRFLNRPAVVIVDDVDRPADREMVTGWLASFADLERVGTGCPAGVAILRRHLVE
jgi:predicted O-methyltransferase YrrM